MEGIEEGHVEEDPSAVVVLDGLDYNLHINDYMAAMHDVLSGEDLMVFSAMNGQRRIWIQFFDVREARRAIEVLPAASGSTGVVASLETLPAFEDVWPFVVVTYTSCLRVTCNIVT